MVVAAAPRPAWVLGATGLLGGRCAAARGGTSGLCTPHGSLGRTPPRPWSAVRAEADLASDGADVFWCAGAGVVGSSQEALDTELRVLQGFLEGWHAGGGRSFFLASSAGGVYAGSAGPPFTEETPPAPLAPYGHAKIRAERLTREFADRTGMPVLIGRISNLYGPGQDISKSQGLISQLCRAQLTRQPLSVYVSLDTMRDYLYVNDAAEMSVAALDAVAETLVMHVKILASERSTTIASILGDLHRLARRRPPVVLGTSVNARFQVRDLRLRSVAGRPPRSSSAPRWRPGWHDTVGRRTAAGGQAHVLTSGIPCSRTVRRPLRGIWCESW